MKTHFKLEKHRLRQSKKKIEHAKVIKSWLSDTILKFNYLTHEKTNEYLITTINRF